MHSTDRLQDYQPIVLLERFLRAESGLLVYSAQNYPSKDKTTHQAKQNRQSVVRADTLNGINTIHSDQLFWQKLNLTDNMTTGKQDRPFQIGASATVCRVGPKRKRRSRRTNKVDGDNLSVQTESTSHTIETDSLKKRSCEKPITMPSVDISSPLGQKLIQKLKKPPLNTENLVRCYDRYCNWELEDFGNRKLRSQTDYCADRWNLDNIRYVRMDGHVNLNRPYVFGKRARRRRYKTIKSGLNNRSRRLLPLVKSCSIVLDRSAIYDVEACDKTDNLLKSPDEKVESKDCVPVNEPQDARVDVGDILLHTQAKLCPVLVPLLAASTDTCQKEQPNVEKSPKKCPTDQGATQEDECSPVKWEELVGDAPKLDTEPELVDLTFESDDNTSDLFGTDGDLPPSPTPRRQLADVEQILGDLCDGPIVPTKPLPPIKFGGKRPKMNKPKRKNQGAMSKSAFITWY